MANNHLFPTSAGMYLCSRDDQLIIIIVKGICPVLRLDGGFDLGYYLKKRKLKEASKEVLSNIEIFPEMWTFRSFKSINYSVFSENEFHPTGKLNLADDIKLDIRDKYYLLCQQGVPATKIMRALVQEFKCSMDTIIDLINEYDNAAV